MTPKNKNWYKEIWSLDIKDQSWTEDTKNQVDFIIKTLKLKAMATDSMKLFHNGKVAIVMVTKQQLESAGAVYEDAEGLIEIPRSVSGVEVGIVIKEWKDKTKASIRTNEYVDASYLASLYGGGGHVRAAGLVSDMSVTKLCDDLVEKLKEFL